MPGKKKHVAGWEYGGATIGTLKWFAKVDGEILRKSDGTGRTFRTAGAAQKAAEKEAAFREACDAR